jgi:hypothetical protein
MNLMMFQLCWSSRVELEVLNWKEIMKYPQVQLQKYVGCVDQSYCLLA